MPTGKMFKQMQSDDGRAKIVHMVHDDTVHEDFVNILRWTCAVIRVLNSSKRMVDMEKLMTISHQAYEQILITFPWAKVSKSLHRVLAHSWEATKENNPVVLGNTDSEEAVEALTKLVRKYRERGARKTSPLDNFSDLFMHCWQKSMPSIQAFDRQVKERVGKKAKLTKIDEIVESMFL